MGYKVAVVGATGNVGREMLNILAEREFPADEVVALASRKSIGQEAAYGDKTLKVKALEHSISPTKTFAYVGGGGPSKEWSPKIAGAGAWIDIRRWRWTGRPLIVAEVTATPSRASPRRHQRQHELLDAQIVVALKPLHDRRDQARRGLDL